MAELEDILAGITETTPTPPVETKEEIVEDPEVIAKAEQLANLNKAIAESQRKLKDLRAAKKQPVEEDEVPKIDFNEPSSKAWDKHIRESVNPMQAELEKERDEVRGFALKEFLSTKPALARNPDKLKEVMEVYERSHTATERTQQGVLRDLQKAYAYVHDDELLNRARQERVEQAESDILFSDAGVSRGATAYNAPKDTQPRLSQEDRDILSKWGITPTEYIEDVKKYGKSR